MSTEENSPYEEAEPRRTNLILLQAFHDRAVAEIESSRLILEAHCLHGYEGDRHYEHDGPHDLPTWRELVQLRQRFANQMNAATELIGRLAAVDALCDQIDQGEHAIQGSGSMDFGRGMAYASKLVRGAVGSEETP